MIILGGSPLTGWNFGFPFFGFNQGYQALQRVDTGGIYRLATNAVAASTDGTTVNYGINPCQYNALPTVSLVALTVHADAPTGTEELPVTIVVPRQTTTLESSTTSGTTASTSGTPVTDNQGNAVTGSDMSGGTVRLLWINKCAGTIQVLDSSVAATE